MSTAKRQNQFISYCRLNSGFTLKDWSALLLINTGMTKRTGAFNCN